VILDESLDYEATLATVARLAVPVLADWCAVDLVDEAGAGLREKAIEIDPERKAAMISNMLVVLVGDKDATPVINTGTLYS